MTSSDAIVVGGGVVGCAIAWALAREGLSVTLLERDRIGAHASRAAAGMLAPLAELAPGDALLEAGLASLERFPAAVREARDLSGIDPELSLCGVLRAFGREEAERAKRDARALEPLGCHWLEPDEARKREPRLWDGLAGAIWSPREAHVNSLQLTRAFAGAAARRGAELREGEPVLDVIERAGRITGVRTARGELAAGCVVLCSGAWARAAERWCGLRLPVVPVRGQMLAVESPRPPLASLVWGRGVYLVPRRDGSLAVGATVEDAGFELRNTADGLAWLLAGLVALLPSLAGATFLEAWAGLRPASPDGCPLIGAVPERAGLYLAAGHYRNGVLLAPITAFWLADWIVRDQRDPLLERFDPARFGRV